jgi:hypothetical protein
MRCITWWTPGVLRAAEFRELPASLELGHGDASVPFYTPKSKIDIIKITRMMWQQRLSVLQLNAEVRHHRSDEGPSGDQTRQ